MVFIRKTHGMHAVDVMIISIFRRSSLPDVCEHVELILRVLIVVRMSKAFVEGVLPGSLMESQLHGY